MYPPLRFLILFAAYSILSSAAAPAADTTNPLRYYYPLPQANPPQTIESDVCVYGGTPGGITAAIQAARMGKKTVLLEFSKYIGGVTASGLSDTDGGQIAGGIGREFYNVVGKMWFHPSQAEAQFRKMLDEAKVTIYLENRLTEVKNESGRITEIKTENGNCFRAKIFIDASYEGDLMALAGVSFHIGREANSVYGETHNGIRSGGDKLVDPYVVPGDPTSGLLPRVSSEALGTPGDGDGRIQSYNFRMFFEQGGLPFPKPEGYDPKEYALLARFIAGGGSMGLSPHKGDVNNNGGFSTDNLGANYEWPDGPGIDAAKPVPVQRHLNIDQVAYSQKLYETRERIFQDHVTYQQGLIYFLANDPQLPDAIHAKMNQWGLTRNDFFDTGGWPHTLYVREGRRMVSDYVMTQANCTGGQVAEDSIGLAEYTMDSHNVRRLVINGVAHNEGTIGAHTPQPYPISYRAIVPKATECTNLLVPVAVSSSHVGYAPIRMEPVFMVLGQSAGTAAALAIDQDIPVQKVDYPTLRARLLQDQQLLDLSQMPLKRAPDNGPGPATPAPISH